MKSQRGFPFLCFPSAISPGTLGKNCSKLESIGEEMRQRKCHKQFVVEEGQRDDKISLVNLLLIATNLPHLSNFLNEADLFSWCIRGCILMDLYLEGRIVCSGKTSRSFANYGIQVKNCTPTGNPLLDEALSLMLKADLDEYTVSDLLNSLYGKMGPLFTDKTVGKMSKVVQRAYKYAVEEGYFRMIGGGTWYSIPKPTSFLLISDEKSIKLWESIIVTLRSHGKSALVNEALLFLTGILSILSLDGGCGPFVELREVLFWGEKQMIVEEWGFPNDIPVSVLHFLVRKKIQLMV